MQQDPMQHLLAEHKEILAEFAALQTVVDRLEAVGESALAEALPVFQRIGEMMATRLEQHARKEDDALFPAVEAMIGAGSPTGMMRDEHKEIHDQGVLLRETLHELNEVEHPRIEAGGERLRELAASSGRDVEQLRSTAREILHLVKIHFEKEEQILFPMAYNLLEAETLRDVYEQIVALDEAGH